VFSVIYSPDFALQAVTRMEAELAGVPVALVEDQKKKAVVTQVNEVAEGAGVRLGMTAPQALARCVDLVLRSRSGMLEKEMREVLLAAAFTLSPRVEETGEGIWTNDLRGTRRADFLGRASKLVRELSGLGLVVRIGAGRNPLLALLAAKRANPVLVVDDERVFLAELPVSLLDPLPQLAEILEQWGIRTLGALARLSRAQVASRLGVDGIALWDRACGREARVLRLAELPKDFEEYLELEYEEERLEPLLFLLRRMVGALTFRLRVAYLAAEEVRLELGLSDGSRYERTFRLPEPTREADLLFRMLHTHLEGVRAEFPIVSVMLRIEPCRPVSKQQDLFEATVKDPYQFSDTIAQLGAVVGSGNVGSPRREPTHRPDAFRMEPLAEIQKKWEKEVEENLVWAGGLPMRRFRPAVEARVRMKEGRPDFVDSVAVRGAIVKTRGPWRLSGNWWEPERWAREEWDVELAEGGIYRLVRERNEWFLEGSYG